MLMHDYSKIRFEEWLLKYHRFKYKMHATLQNKKGIKNKQIRKYFLMDVIKIFVTLCIGKTEHHT